MATMIVCQVFLRKIVKQKKTSNSEKKIKSGVRKRNEERLDSELEDHIGKLTPTGKRRGQKMEVCTKRDY